MRQGQFDNVYTLTFTANAAETSPERLFLTINRTNQPITTGIYTDEGSSNENLLVAGGYNPATTDDSNIFAARFAGG